MYYKQGRDETEVNLMVGLRLTNCWKNLVTMPLQASPFLDSDVYPVLQVKDMANVAQPRDVVIRCSAGNAPFAFLNLCDINVQNHVVQGWMQDLWKRRAQLALLNKFCILMIFMLESLNYNMVTQADQQETSI